MIRVLIAEDEPPTMRRLKRLIEETDASFSVVATAADGEKALEMLDHTPCDVVFTDIRMPVMDGLALMDAIHARLPDCLVVAVSGYQDFAYVSHAIRAQIFDYVLKPVSQQDMASLLTRLRTAHDARRRQRMERQLSQHVNRLRPPPARESADGGAPLAICLFSAGTLPPSDEAEMYPAAEAWQALSPEKALATLFPADTGFAWAFMGNTPVERVLIFETEQPDCVPMARALHAHMAALLPAPLNCACAEDAVPLPETGHVIRQLRRLLKSGARIGHGEFFVLADTPPAPLPPVEPQTAERLAAQLRGGLRQDAPFWRELLLRMDQEAWPQARVYALFMRALDMLEADSAFAPQVPAYREVCTELLCTALSMEEITEGLSGLQPLAAREGDAAVGIAADVEAYLRVHYREHINNQTLSQAFGYVPSYISMLFRKAYGQSPSEYLTRVRLEEAKRLLQSQPTLLIREVAEMVGFKSQHHFSRIFKKNEGMWPSSYQP